MDWLGPQWNKWQSCGPLEKSTATRGCTMRTADRRLSYETARGSFLFLVFALLASLSSWVTSLRRLLRAHSPEPFGSICTLCRYCFFAVHRYVLSVCILGCVFFLFFVLFWPPPLRDRPEHSKHAHGLGPVPLAAPCSNSHTENGTAARTSTRTQSTQLFTGLGRNTSTAVIEFQTQSMSLGNCTVNQCLSKPRQ